MRRCLIYMMVFCLAKLCWVVILISIFQMRKLNFGKRGNLPVVMQLGKDQNHASGPGLAHSQANASSSAEGISPENGNHN